MDLYVPPVTANTQGMEAAHVHDGISAPIHELNVLVALEGVGLPWYE